MSLKPFTSKELFSCQEFRMGVEPMPGGGGVLPYMGYIGTCRGIGYGFWRFSILKKDFLFAYVGTVSRCDP